MTSAEAAARLQRYGANRLESQRRFSLLRKVLSRFRNPLVLILLAAATVSAFTGDIASLVIIAIMVLFSVLLDSVQEYRAEQAADQLKISVALKEQALRDGREITVRADQLVPGDVVVLAAGDLVPADGRVIEARDFFVNEGPADRRILSGRKARRAAMASPTSTSRRPPTPPSWAPRSSAARPGLCFAQPETGRNSARSAPRCVSTPPPAALEKGVYEFGILIVRLTILLVLFVLLVNTLSHRPLLESFLFAIALAVGLTPELLPMIVSVTLARGALRMARQKVIVKRLAAIHDLGSMDVLCTDKTGTLTEAKIALDPAHRPWRATDSERVLELAWLNSHFESGLRSPLDDAILEHAPHAASAWTKIDEVPFDFERRRVSVLIERAGARLLVVKGAPEDVLKLSSRYELAGENDIQPLDAAAMARATAQFHALGEEGFRVLGIAWRDEPADAEPCRGTRREGFRVRRLRRFSGSAEGQRGRCDRSAEAQRHRHQDCHRRQ